MTESRIKESLKTAIENSTPDILEELMTELEIKDEPKELMHDMLAEEQSSEKKWIPRMKRRSNMMKAFAGCAAALMVVVAGMGLAASKEALAVVSLDVNPSIEISIDKNERVLDANPINDEASEIIGEMNLKGSDIDVACNAIVGSMLTHGYLTDIQNSLLVSVSADDEQLGTEIERRLSKDLNSYLENTEIAASILGQYVNNDEAIKTYAAENGISIGKAWLIQNLLKTGSTKMKESDLLGLTTQELILLGQKRGVTKDVSYGSAESSKYIGNEKALSIALEKAGADRASASNIRHEFDCENGVLIYEISFRVGDYEYDYDINAYDGSVVAYEKEYDPIYTAPSGGSDGSSSGSSGGSGSNSSSSGSSGGSGSNASSAPSQYYDDDDDDDYDDRYDDYDDDDYDDDYDDDDRYDDSDDDDDDDD